MQGDQLGGRRNRLMSEDENLKLGRHGGDAYKAKCEYWGQNNRVALHVVWEEHSRIPGYLAWTTEWMTASSLSCVFPEGVGQV